MSKSAPITITSSALRQQVENRLDTWIPDGLWRRAEPYARRKLDINRERTPEIDYYDNNYLVLLTADTVAEFDFADHINTLSMAMMAGRENRKEQKQ